MTTPDSFQPSTGESNDWLDYLWDHVGTLVKLGVELVKLAFQLRCTTNVMSHPCVFDGVLLVVDC